MNTLEAAPLRILHEGNDFLVLYKPAHLLIHPSKPGGPRTLLHHLKDLCAYELRNGGQLSIINRLDRETSGIVLVATTTHAARRFGKAMARRQIHKGYLAIVCGWPESNSFTIDAPLRRKGEILPSPIWLKQIVHPDGRPSSTHFKVLQRLTHPAHENQRFALVEATPITGRTHQIRVHLAHCGHPVAGDKIYGPSEECYLSFIDKGWSPALARKLIFDRHTLHSHLMNVENISYHCPLPDDMNSWLKEARESHLSRFI